jgi:3',5'-cyclic AMP phosphodiesterase CpdA
MGAFASLSGASSNGGPGEGAQVLDFLPPVQELCRNLAQGQPVLYHAPKLHGKGYLLDRVAREYRKDPAAVCIPLSSRVRTASKRLDFQSLWDQTAAALGVDLGRAVDGPGGYEAAFMRAVKATGRRAVVLLSGARRGNEENHLDLLATYQRILKEFSSRDDHSRPIVLATDDYSLYLDRRVPFGENLSHLSEFRYVYFLPPVAAELGEALVEVTRLRGRPLAPEPAQEFAELILRVSGGHIGLIRNIVDDLIGREWKVNGKHWSDEGPAYRACLAFTETLGRAMGDDALALSEIARKYAKPSVAERVERVDVLRQLGILLRIPFSPPDIVQLCPGAIARMMERAGQWARPSGAAVGTILSDAGPRLHEAGVIALNDDDLVVVHLSDLHVGNDSQYRFRLAGQGVSVNRGGVEADAFLFDDLRSLTLHDRVDALVVSGDFVWLGRTTEFDQARGVIEGMLKRLKLKAKDLVTVPGNHDVEWADPDDPLARVSATGVSRSNYDNFIELLGKRRPSAEGADLVTVISPSGKVKIRILELDSNKVEGPKSGGVGYVARSALERADRLLRDDKTAGFKDVATWVVLHHHVFPSTSHKEEIAGRREVTVLANAAELLDYFTKWEAELILHGHEHQPTVSVSRRWPADPGSEFCPVVVLGAGSFGAGQMHLGPFGKVHYYIICRRSHDIIVRSRCLNDTGVKFTHHQDLSLGRRLAAAPPQKPSKSGHPRPPKPSKPGRSKRPKKSRN